MQLLFKFLQFLVGFIKPRKNVQKTYSINCESWRVRKYNKSLSGMHEEKTMKKSKKIELLFFILHNQVMMQNVPVFRYFSLTKQYRSVMT